MLMVVAVETEVVTEIEERGEERQKMSLNSRELAKRYSNRIGIGDVKGTAGQQAHAVGIMADDVKRRRRERDNSKTICLNSKYWPRRCTPIQFTPCQRKILPVN